MIMQIALGIFIGFIMLAGFGVVIFLISKVVTEPERFKFFDQPDDDDYEEYDDGEELFSAETIHDIRFGNRSARRQAEIQNLRKRYDFDT